MTRSGWERNIDVCTKTCATTILLHWTRAGGVVPVLVNRYCQHVPVLQERGLLRVAVVHIPVDDCHASKFVDLSRTTRDEYIVCENAKAPSSVPFRVVSRWANEAIRVPNIAFHDRVEGG